MTGRLLRVSKRNDFSTLATTTAAMMEIMVKSQGSQIATAEMVLEA
jgi:hypothetical protein